MGSIGVGCTIDKNVYVDVEKSTADELIFNGIPINFPTVSSVVFKLAPLPVKVVIRSELPLGYGFGISSASALACVIGLNKLFNLGKDKSELAKIAHVSEIVNHTGLGSVATQITGGFLLKRKPGLPVSAIKLPFIGGKLYAVILDKLLTPSILKDEKMIQKVNSTADFYLKKLISIKSPQLADVIDASFDFAAQSGLLTDERVINIITRIKRQGGSATMAILGKVVIANMEPTFIHTYKTVELVITNSHL